MKTKVTTDQGRKFVEQPKGPVLVSVSGGVAEVIDSTVPKGIEVEIVDFDNMKDTEPGDLRMSEAAWEYLRTDDPRMYELHKDGRGK
jgi:hypothetical protein